MSYKVVLASASPRRRELLRLAGIEFEARASQITEQQMPGESPADYVCRLARQKAEAVAPGCADLVLGADTEVVMDGRVFGKPESDAHAAEMLRTLSGRTHQVLTGMCLLDPVTGNKRIEKVETAVTFAKLSEPEIAEYVASGEPRDKAGAYAIQGLAAKFVERIEGCYFNVMGLPVATVYRMLKGL